MKKILNTFFLLIPFAIGAQSILVSKDIPLRNDVSYELIGELRGQILLFRNRTTEFEVQAFDEMMNETWDKPIELDKKYPEVVGINALESSFNIFYRFREKSHTVLKIHTYDPGANLIDSVTIKDFGYLFYTPNFEIVYSEDKSKAILFFIEKQRIFNVLSFDIQNMQVLWEQTFEFDDLNYFQEYRQMLVDNLGNMYLILEKDNFRSKRKTHYYSIHEFVNGNETLRSFNIPMRGNLTYDAYFTYDNLNKNLVSSGLYSDKNIGRADGFFYLSINPNDHKDHLLTFEEFDDDFISNLLGKQVKNNKGLTETSVQEVVLRRDGGVLLIAEKTKELERRIAGSARVFYDGSSRFIVDYYYEELFVISIHPDGKTHWKTILHKKQFSQDDDAIYSSYFLFKTPTSLRFLFNDEIKHENTVSEYVVNGIGEYDRNSILSTEKLQIRLRFRDALQIAANQVIIPSERRNRLKLVKLEY